MANLLMTAQVRTLDVDIVPVAMAAPFAWLQKGWLDLRSNWGASVGYGALIMALGWTLLVFCGTHPYFIAAAISGFLLVGPLMSAGFCEMSRRYSRGQPASFDDSLEGFVQHVPALMELGVILAICAAGWFLISALLLGNVFHIGTPSIGATLYQGFLDSANRPQVLAYIVVGGVLASAVFTLTVIAIPLIVDRDASAGQAMRESVRATGRNIAAMIVWSALILSLTIVGYASLLIGMLVVAPLLGHATWHAYAELTGQPRSASRVGREEAATPREEPENPNEAREAHLRRVGRLTSDQR